MRMTLAVHTRQYSIHSFPPSAPIPSEVFAEEVYFICKTEEGLTLVVPSELAL
ncbi:MAG: ACT domain-containing protein, partial [Shewanella sp.]